MLRVPGKQVKLYFYTGQSFIHLYKTITGSICCYHIRNTYINNSTTNNNRDSKTNSYRLSVIDGSRGISWESQIDLKYALPV